MKTMVRVMKALSDPSRIKIVKLLEQKELCVCELTSVLGLAQSTVSKHLKLLEDAGIVASNRDGGWVNYRLADGSESPYAESLLRDIKGWLNDDAAIREVFDKLPGTDRLRTSAA